MGGKLHNGDYVYRALHIHMYLTPVVRACSSDGLQGGGMPGDILRERTMDGFVTVLPVLLSVLKGDCLRYNKLSYE